jgi:hypothetical protein
MFRSASSSKPSSSPEKREQGNHPFGSLLTIDDTVVLIAKNTVFTDRDALSSEQLGTIAGRNFLIPCTELFARASEKVTVTGPMLLSEAREVHIGYWPLLQTEAI